MSSCTVIDKATSHSTKLASEQVAGYPVKTGIQKEQKSRVADKTIMLSRHAGNYSINWIPAFAGMTGL
jgi:hypothetical protein